MQSQTRKTFAALLAASLLVLGSISTASAHGPGGDPGHQPKAHETVKAHQSVDPSHETKDAPEPAKATKDPKTAELSKDWFKRLDCPVKPTPAPTTTTAADKKAKLDKLDKLDNARIPGFKGDFAKEIGRWPAMFKGEWAKVYCSPATLKPAADNQITREIARLQALSGAIGKDASLSVSEKAVLTGEIGKLVATLQSLKTKIDAETTLTAVQADYVNLTAAFKADRNVSSWIKLILGVDEMTADGKALDLQAIQFAAQIAALPVGTDTAEVQALLADLKTNSTAAQGLVAPLHAQLLALNPSNVASGAAATSLHQIRVTAFLASWDLARARHDARDLKHELKELQPEAKPTPTPTPTPTVTPTPAPTV